MSTPAKLTGGERNNRGVIFLVALAALAGALVGVVGGAFRWCLDRASELSSAALHWSHGLGSFGWLVPVAGVALCGALAAMLVRWVPLAAGSGIQHVEAVDKGEAALPQLRVLPVKFIGGVLAIGSGFVLGREGPTVHMGAILGTTAGRVARRPHTDVVTLQSSLSGAGLAVAFNAPIGGALFVFEEVTKSFRLRTVLTTAVGVAVAVGVSWTIIGQRPDFTVAPQAYLPLGMLPVMVVFGVLTGLLGVLYNRLVIGSLRVADRLKRVPREVTAGVIGALIGLAIFANPDFGGGGDALSQSLLSGTSIALPLLVLYLVVRFFAGPLSYAAGTPGGLFAPLLAVGATWGVIFSSAVSWLFPGESVSVSLAVIGMAAFFAATVRAPLTGAVIVMEMTALTAVAVPMLIAAGAAVLTAALLRSAPIYDRLRERMLSASTDRH